VREKEGDARSIPATYPSLSMANKISITGRRFRWRRIYEFVYQAKDPKVMVSASPPRAT